MGNIEKKQILLHKNSSPMLVNSSENETDEMMELRWSKFDNLPENIKDKLSHQDTVKIVQGISKKYNLSVAEVAFISRAIRGYYFRELKLESFESYLSQTIPKLTISQVQDIIHIINIKILQQEFTSDTNKKQVIKLSLNEAIQKYPQILKQHVTNKKIITKPFLKPLVPNVKNWIMVYEKILNVSSHTMIERGNFVFRSEATKGLNEEDRKKLLTLFKSRDDNSKLTIDTGEGLIIFDVQEAVEQRGKLDHNHIPAKKDEFNNNRESKNPQLKKLGSVSDVNILKQNTKTQEQNVISKVAKHTPVQNNKLQDVGAYHIQNSSTQVENKFNDMQGSDLLQDMQKEIIKNRIEMGNKKPDERKIKKNNSKKKQNQRYKPIKNNGNNLIENRTIIKAQREEDTIKKENSVYGDVSFSSNHIMPAEMNKKKAILNNFDAFNIKPLGRKHKKVNKIKDADENI